MSRTVLITGANSGLGFDSARQLAASGRWDRVILSARSQQKGDGAVARLMEATGRPSDAFGVSVFDNNLPETIGPAVEALAAAGATLDAIILNAGGMATPNDDGTPATTPSGRSAMYEMNVGGHAHLVHGLIERGLLSKGATVMFAGSEASRGIPAMGAKTPTVPEGLGDLAATLQAVVHATHVRGKYDPMVDYGFVKLIGTVWMRHLHEQHGLRALTVSPGFTGGTAAMDNLPTAMKVMFRYVMLPIMTMIGNAHGLETGAARYLQGLEDTSLKAGGFYASPGNKTSGDMVEQTVDKQPLLGNADFHAAVGRLLAPSADALRKVS